ncbi:MAG: DNA recombination protein RmuC [Bacteroidia bacterium]
MDYVSLIIGIVVGALVGFLLAKSRKETNEGALAENNFLKVDNEKKETELKQLREAKSELESRIAASIEKFKSQEEKLNSLKEELENINKKYTTEFENIANKILDEKTQKFTEQNKTNLDGILTPLKERIKEFSDKVDKAYKEESQERTTLKTEIKHLIELNKQVSEDANNLAKALKGDSQQQGSWGEFILESVLEKSGLVKDREYVVQESFSQENNTRSRPDVIVKLPDNKNIIIDSKVSLVAYERFVSEQDEASKILHLKEHIQSVKNHIKGLSEKSYQDLHKVGGLDFVLLFIPIESAFALGVQHDNKLFTDAFEKNIVLVSPSTLLATLRTIANIWRTEHQNKNAQEIGRLAGAMFDKLSGFAGDMEDIKKSIDKSNESYEKAINKLKTGKGNVMSTAQKIKSLGAKTSKQLPEEFLGDDDLLES